MCFCCCCWVDEKFSQGTQQCSFSFWNAIIETWQPSMDVEFIFRVSFKFLLYIVFILVLDFSYFQMKL